MLVIIIRHMHIVVVCVILFVAALLSGLLLSVLREEGIYSPQLVTAKVDNRFYIAKYLQNNLIPTRLVLPVGIRGISSPTCKAIRGASHILCLEIDRLGLSLRRGVYIL